MKAAFYSGKVCVQISKFQDMFSMQLIYHTLGQHFAMVECMANEKYLYCRFQLQVKAKKEKKTLSYVHPTGHDGKDCMLNSSVSILAGCLSERHADILCLARLRTGGSEHFADERECFSAQRADGRSGSENSAKSSNLAPV